MRIDDTTRKPTTVITTVAMSDDNKPAYPIPGDMPEDKDKPAIITTKSIRDGDRTTTITTTMVPIQGVPDDYTFTPSDLKEVKFPGFDGIPNGDTKTCTIKVQNIPDGKKSSTVTTTTVPIQDKPLMIEYPVIGNTFTEDAKPCVVSTKTIEDGKQGTLVSTIVTASKDVPDSDESIPVEPKDIDLSGLVDKPEDVQPGTVVVKTIDDAEPKTVTATLVTSSDGKPGLVAPANMPKGKDKPAIITTKSTKDGDITTTVTTTMVPIQNLPDNYHFTLDDLKENRFPGFDVIPNGETKTCSVAIDNIPEGNKITTVATATTSVDGKPLMIELPGFGNVAAEDAKPCVVTSKTLKDDDKSTMVTTTVTAYQDIPGSDETILLDSKSIEIAGFVDRPEDYVPGTFVVKPTEGDKPVMVTGTVVTSEDNVPAYPIPDDMPTGQSKPAIVTTKSMKEGDVTATFTTTMVPVQDLPDDYKFTPEDIKDGRFPGFDGVPEGDTKTCTVTIDNIPEGNKTNTVTTTIIQPEDKPLVIDFPGFGTVATEDTKPCVISAETVKDGPNTTMITTTVTSTQGIPGTDERVPLTPDHIDISRFIDRPQDSSPGICVTKTVDDADTPVMITGTLVTSDDNKPAYPIPSDMQMGQDKPAIITTKSYRDGDKTTTVVTTMVPVQDLPDDYKFTSIDLKDNKYPGFDSLPDGDTKSCTVTINNVPEGNKVSTTAITTVPIEDKPLVTDFPGFGAVYTDDSQPCVIALETISGGNKKTVVSTTVTASQDIPGSDNTFPLDSKFIDISSFVDKPEDSKPGIMVVRTIDDPEKPVTITATLITTEDEGKTPIPEEISSDEKKPGVISTKTLKDGDTTTTIMTTLIPVEGVPADNDGNILELKDQGFPGFDKVSPSDEDVKPCTITANSIRDGDKTTTVTVTEIDDSKKPETITYQFMQNIPPSITFNIVQTGIYGFDPLPVKDAEPCVIATKSIKDGNRTTLLTTTLQEIPDEGRSRDIAYPKFDKVSIEEAKPGIVVAKTITGDNNRTIEVASSIVVEDDKEHPVRGPKIESITQDKPGIVTTKTVNINDKPTEIKTTIVPLSEETGAIVIDPKETALTSFYDVPTENIKPCYVTVTEGKDGIITATITTMVVTDQDINDTGIILSSDKKVVEPEPKEDDVRTTVTTTTTITTTVNPEEDKPDGDKAYVKEQEVGIEIEGGGDFIGDISGGIDLEKPKEPEQIITTTTTTITTEDTDKLHITPQAISEVKDEVGTEPEGVGDGSGICDFDQTIRVPTTVVEQIETLFPGDKVSHSNLRQHFCIVLGHCLQTVKINNVNTSLVDLISACCLSLLCPVFACLINLMYLQLLSTIKSLHYFSCSHVYLFSTKV